MSSPSDDNVPPSGSEEVKPDIRVSTHRDLGVDISRDLTESGRLARGDRSNMSRLSFSARGRPRDEADPELLALREPAPPLAASPAPSEAIVDPAPKPPAAPDGILARVRHLFGGG